MANLTCQDYVAQLAELVPNQAIIVSDVKGVPFAKSREFEQETRVRVRIANFCDWEGTKEEILSKVEAKAKARQEA